MSSQIRVSVVVPVYNPGPSFHDLIASLDAQSLPLAAFEIVLCDDGSNAETHARLAEVASRRPNVRVLLLPRTGWPGTPRNHGIQAARGDYVQFVDQDDALYPEALERLVAFADHNHSDVIIGRVIGRGRRIPAAMFARDIPRAELGRDPLLELLTPHKMFRTAFLRRTGIRFPDGKVRLEDHMFVLQAYFAADVISILASTPCYAWGKTEGSASSSRIDPDTYFPHLATVVSIVEENTEPGPLRTKLLRHWYRGKILARMEGRRLMKWPREYRARFLRGVAPLVTRFPVAMDPALALPLRIRSSFLRSEDLESQLRFAQFEAGLVCTAELTKAEWSRRGKLVLTISVCLMDADNNEVAFVAAPSASDAEVASSGQNGSTTRLWSPPQDLRDLKLDPSVIDATKDLRRDQISLDLIDDADRRFVRFGSKKMKDLRTVRMTIDPILAFRDAPLSRGGVLRAQVRRGGWVFDLPLTALTNATAGLGRSPLLAGRRCELTTNTGVHLSRAANSPASASRDAIARAVRSVGRTVRAALRPVRRAARRVLARD